MTKGRIDHASGIDYSGVQTPPANNSSICSEDAPVAVEIVK